MEKLENDFFNQNSSFVLPSRGGRATLYQRVEKIVRALLVRLHLLQDWNREGLAAALLRGERVEKNLESLSEIELIQYWNRVFQKDQAVSAGFKKCLRDFVASQTLAEKLKSVKPLSRINQSRPVVHRMASEIYRLRIGERKLYQVNANANDRIFYLFSRDQEGYRFKIIGRGESMEVLGGTPQLTQLDKNQLRATQTFVGIPPEVFQDWGWIETLISHTQFGKGFDRNAVHQLTQHLKLYRQKGENEKTVAKTSHIAKNLFTAVEEGYREDRGGFPKEQKRLELRLQMATLFDYFSQHRQQLTVDSVPYETLHALHRQVSDQVTRANKKHSLTEKELQAIVKELKVIKDHLQKAKQVPVTLKHLPPIGMERYLKHRIATHQPEKRSLQQSKSVVATIPEWDSSLPNKTINLEESRIGDKATLLGTLGNFDLNKSAPEVTRQQILSTVRQIRLDFNWTSLTEREREHVMEKLQTLSKWLVEHPDQNSEMQDYEAALKTATIVLAINRLDKKASSLSDFYVLLNRVENFYNTRRCYNLKVFTAEIWERGGHQYVHLSHQTAKELLEFCRSFQMEVSRGANTKRNFAPFYRQMKCVAAINPFQREAFFYRTNQIKQWTPLLKYASLFAAYRNMAFSMQEHPMCGGVVGVDPLSNLAVRAMPQVLKDQIVENETQKLATRFGWMVPEAVADQPELVADHLVDKYNALMNELKGIERKLIPGKERLEGDKLPFSGEELSDLLLVLRHQDPQSEIVAFMEKYPHVVEDTSVQHFFSLLFFTASLPNFLERNELFRNELPKILEKGLSKHFLFSYHFLTKLKNLYRTLGYSTEAFSEEPKNELERQYRQAVLTASDNSDFHEMLSVDLYERLSSITYETKDIADIIIRHTLWKNLSQKKEFTDPQRDHFIQQRFLELFAKENLDQSVCEFVLNAICQQKQMELNGTAWKGDYPVFQNGQYRINLQTGKIDFLLGQKVGQLPNTICEDPFFQETFRGIYKEQMLVTMEQKGNKKIFRFEGGQIEQKSSGAVRYFRSLKYGKEGILQAVPLTKELASLPLFSTHQLLVDPYEPHLGYCLDKEGNLAFKVNFTKGWMSDTIESIVVCRGEEEGPRRQVTSLKHYPHDGLVRLAALEHPEQILVWGVNHNVSHVELPRLGLTFVVQDQELVCTHPEFCGYRVDLNATVEQRGDIPFSLLFKPENPTKSAKLLVPKTAQLELFETKDKQHIYQISSKGTEGSFAVFDLRPITHDVIASSKNRVSDTLEVLKQLFKTNRYSAAFHVFSHFDLKKGELDQETVKAMVTFLGNSYSQSGPEAALKIQLMVRLKQLTKNDGQFLKLRNALNEMLANEMKRYLEAQKHLSKAYRLTDRHYYVAAKQLTQRMPQSQSQTKAPSEGSFWGSYNMYTLRQTTLSGFEHFNTQSERYFPYFIPLYRHFSATKRKDRFYWELKASLPPSGRVTTPEEHAQRLLMAVAEEENKSSLPNWDQLLKEDPTMHRFFEQLKRKYPTFQTLSPLPTAPLPEKKSLVKVKAPVVENALPPFQASSFSCLDGGKPLLFEERELQDYFTQVHLPQKKFAPPKLEGRDLEACEERALSELAENMAKHGQDKREWQLNQSQRPQLEALVEQKYRQIVAAKKEKREEIFTYLNEPESVVKRLKIWSDNIIPPTMNELKMALFRGKLTDETLKRHVIAYFDLETKDYLAEKSLELLKEAIPQTDQSLLYRMLTRLRRYEIDKHPQLLLFEAFTFQTFREVSGEQKTQLELILQLLDKPNSVVQASTGSGKTMVISVLRNLLQANGTNLVVQKVLPHLYEQTLSVTKQTLGETFQSTIYPLRFNLNMPLYELGRTKKGDIIKVSLFKSMYEEMVRTIQNKGCILTDYKSLPLLEEKFWKLDHDLLHSGRRPDPLEKEHWEYLRKILLLLKERSLEMMDEFDRPMRPIHRIQIQMGAKGIKPPAYIWETSLAIYDELAKQEELHLKDNLQSEISKEKRQQALANVAKTFSERLEKGQATAEMVKDYLLGKDERVLGSLNGWSEQDKDNLALCKEQFCLYLPLTLSYARKSRYARSEDGKRILPCFNGEKSEAKFGCLLEEINYMIQDYLQGGVVLAEVQEWLKKIKEGLKTDQKETAETEFKRFFPNESIEDADAEHLLKQLNANPDHVKHFLKARLNLLKVSDAVVSMTPQNIVSMSRSVSGLSATLGAKEALHRQFQVDRSEAGQIQAGMAYRLLRRNGSPEQLPTYDPRDPLGGISRSYTAVIDGAGALRDCEKEKVETLLEEGGYYFPQPETRGADKKLRPDGQALLTVTEQGTLEDLNQQEGRMRSEDQQVIFIRSQYSERLATIQDVIATKVCNQARNHAEDVYRAKIHEIRDRAREDAREKLLAQDNLDEHLKLFQTFERHFITPPQPSYLEEGSFFKQNCHLVKKDQKPKDNLHALCQKLHIDPIDYPEELLKCMPDRVAPLTHAESTETEVEQEEETEREEETELATEQDIESDREVEHLRSAKAELPFYLPRVYESERYSLRETIHPDYDSNLFFTESFLPLSRKQQMFKRKPFDDKTYRIGVVKVLETGEIIIGDVLDGLTKYHCSYSDYDIRMNRFIHHTAPGVMRKEFPLQIAQIKFFNGQFDGYTDEEWTALKDWLKPEHRRHFEQIIANRPEQCRKFPFSPLAKLFSSLR
ncbi:MAG: DUF3638 domain-containing protein [Chlamydiia bacterium]|nr:DUF3638 domain-containing protein [Chlamydiia bacterium]